MGAPVRGWRAAGAGALAFALLVTTAGCDDLRSSSPPEEEHRKIVVLGFDGVDPDFVKEWISAEKLPHLAGLAATGTFLPLGSTNPPQSPVAWSTFATGMNPGKHGIYDFVKRDPATYLPTVAYGTGQVYLNLEGRERDGIVPIEQAGSVAAEIARRLEAFEDPEKGERPLRKVYLGSDIFPGADPSEMPDHQLAFREGWRTSWETILGGIPDALTGPNMRKWSGDHAASDVADTHGVILVNRRIDMDDPRIVDLSPTLLHQYGITPPPDVDGRRLW